MRYKTFIELVFLSIVACGLLSATDSVEVDRTLVLAAGCSNFRMMDRQTTPLKYAAISIPLQIGLYHQSEKCIWGSNLELSAGLAHSIRFKSRVVVISEVDQEGDPATDEFSIKYSPVIQTAINYEYLTRVDLITNERYKVYAGARVQEYFLFWYNISPTIMNQITLDPKISILYNFNDKILISSSLSFSLVGLNTRMNYSLDPYSAYHGYAYTCFKECTKFNTVLNFQRIDLSLAAQKQLNERWSAGLTYRFCWFHHPDYRGIKTYGNSVNITFCRTLKSKNK